MTRKTPAIRRSTVCQYPNVTPGAERVLRSIAHRYIWWKTADEAMEFPHLFVATIMNMGDYDDILQVTDAVGDDYLRQVIAHAVVGQFSPKSWHFWHYRLSLAAEPEQVSPLPTRRTA